MYGNDRRNMRSGTQCDFAVYAMHEMHILKSHKEVPNDGLCKHLKCKQIFKKWVDYTQHPIS